MMSSRGGAVNFVTGAYASTDVAKDQIEHAFWDGLASLAQRVPSMECVFYVHEHPRANGEEARRESAGPRDSRHYGSDELDDSVRLLLTFATGNKLAVT